MGHLDFLHLDARNNPDPQQQASTPQKPFPFSCLSNSFERLSLSWNNKILTKIEVLADCTKSMSQ